ncbi:MAG: YceI family protein [Calditrichaeota bacterium]|nr:YceI family protein [Calditrichota bacterium]
MSLARLLALLLLSCVPLRAEVTEFLVKTTDARQLIQFVSEAPLEKIVGRTREVRGKVTLDLSNLRNAAKGTITVPLEGLDTGLSLRNQHMRTNHLHTETYPEVQFALKRIVSADPADISRGGTASVLLEGELTLHGVARVYEILGTLSYDQPSGKLRVLCEWPISLAEHEIPRPAFLFMRLSDTQEITVDIELTQ